MAKAGSFEGFGDSLLGLVPVLVIVLDKEDKITYINPRVEEITGWKRKEIIGRPFETIFQQNPLKTRETIGNLFSNMLQANGESPFEGRFKNRWGSEKTVLWTGTRFQDARRKAVSILIGMDITKRSDEDRVRLKLQERVSLGKKEWRTIFDGITDMLMVLKPDFTIRKTNKATSVLFSVPLERILGRRCCDLCQGRKGTPTSCPVSRSVRIKKPASGEVYSDTLNKYLLVTSYPLLDSKGNIKSIIAYHKDLTRIKQAQEKLEKTNSLLEALIDSSESALLMTDEKGQVIVVNKKFYELFGIKDGVSLKGREDIQRVMEKTMLNPEELHKKFQFIQDHRHEHITDEIEVAATSDEKTLLRQTVPVMDKKGEFIGQLELYTDITEIKRIQSEALHTEKLVALGEMVAGVAHELNNPLATISGFSQLLLLRKDIQEEIKLDLKKIASEGERARRVIENLLSFARYHEPEMKEVNLPDVMDNTLELLEYELKGTDIDVVKEYDKELPVIKGDPYQIQEVFLNIVKNAIYELKTLDRKGIITIVMKVRGNFVETKVEDNGGGIPRNNLKKIFDPFFTTKPTGQGTGMGLSVSFGIVQRHGGTIYARNRSSGGAEFVIKLPIDNPRIHEIRGEGVTEGMGEKDKLSGKALVVDDEGFVLELLKRFLEQEGMSVTTARNGIEAEEFIERPFDLVVLDLVMPKKPGNKVFEELRESGNPNINKILFLTGDSIDPNTLSFLESSGRPWLFKPFKLEDLKAKVLKILENRE